MFDLKVINSVIGQLEEERGIPRAKMIDAIEQALATAYKKEFGKRGQIVRAKFDIGSGATEFNQIKIVVDDSTVYESDEELPEEDERGGRGGRDREEKKEEEKKEAIRQLADGDPPSGEEDTRVRFDPEKHIRIEDARFIKSGVELGEELVFPLESKDDFGRIAAQTAKQVIIQKIREAEKESALAEFERKEGDIVTGHVQRFERGNLYVDLGRVTGVMPYDQQIPGERYRPGERVRALLLSVEETPRGIFLKLSRSHPDFLARLFTIETPELQNGTVEIRAIAREAGSRSKVAVFSNDNHVDPVGSLVGQRGVRVSTVMSELGGEKIDIIEWAEDPAAFIEDALSPAAVLTVTLDSKPGDAENHATVEVSSDQQSLAIGRGGQNVRLAAKLTNWKIDIVSAGGKTEAAEPEKVDDDADGDPAPETTENKE